MASYASDFFGGGGIPLNGQLYLNTEGYTNPVHEESGMKFLLSGHIETDPAEYAPECESDFTIFVKDDSRSEIDNGLGSDYRSPRFNLDGTKLYLCNYSDYKIYQYPLTTPYDLTSLGAPSTFDTGQSAYHFVCLTFKPDGTKIFATAYYNSTHKLYSWDLTTAWDITTATNMTSIDLVYAYGSYLEFSDDGLHFLYSYSYSTAAIRMYEMTTAWDITTKLSNYDTIGSGHTWLFEENGQLRNIGQSSMVYNISPDFVTKTSLSLHDIKSPVDISTSSYLLFDTNNYWQWYLGVAHPIKLTKFAGCTSAVTNQFVRIK